MNSPIARKAYCDREGNLRALAEILPASLTYVVRTTLFQVNGVTSIACEHAPALTLQDAFEVSRSALRKARRAIRRDEA